MPTPVRYITDGERATGHNSAAGNDVVNRPVKDILTASGLDPDAAAVGFEGFVTPTVLANTPKGTKVYETRAAMLADAPAADTDALVMATKEHFNYDSVNRVWIKSAERPSEEINPKQFVDVGWWDNNGVLNVGLGVVNYITDAEVLAHPEWKGKYYGGIDTRDYVCVEEALLAAFAGPNGAGGQGDIQWFGDQLVGRKNMVVPGGDYRFSRSLWAVGVKGGSIRAAHRFTVTFQQINPDTPVLFVDGISYSEIGGIRFVNGSNACAGKPLVDLDNWGGDPGGLITVWNGVAGSGLQTWNVVSSANPSLKAAGAPGWAVNQWAGYFVVITAGPGCGQVMEIKSNTADTLFIKGFWETNQGDGYQNPPTGASSFAIVPDAGHVGHISYAEANYAASFHTDFSVLGIADGVTHALVGGTDGGGLSTSSVTDVLIASHDKRSITWAGTPITLWTGGEPYLNVDDSLGRRGSSLMWNDFGVIVILTGTTYVGTVASADNHCNLVIDPASGPVWANKQWCGAFAEIVDGTGKGQILPVRANNATTLFFDDWEAATVGDPGLANPGNAMYKQLWTTMPDNTSKVIFRSRPQYGGQMQSNRLTDLYFENTGGRQWVYLAITRAGDMRAMGSENQIKNCTFGGAELASLYFSGFNALNNIVEGGNIYSGPRFGIFSPHGGTVDVKRMHFGGGYEGQFGCDISVNNGAIDINHLDTVRSESRKLLLVQNYEFYAAEHCFVTGAPQGTFTPGIGYTTWGNAAHVYQVGELVVPSTGRSTYGVYWRVVKVTGDGTADAADPNWAGSMASPTNVPFTDAVKQQVHLARYDYNTIGGTGKLTHSYIPWGRVKGYTTQGWVNSVEDCYFTRPDWWGAWNNNNLPPNSFKNNIVIPDALGSGNNAAMQWYLGQATGNAGIKGQFLNHHDRSIDIWMGHNMEEYGLGPGTTAANNEPIFCLIEDGINVPLAKWGKLAPGSQDTPGKDNIIAGGQGTGTGAGGRVLLQAAPAGAVSSAAPNPLADAAAVDGDVTAGNTRFLLYDIDTGALRRVSVGAADSGGVGFKVLRIPN